MTQRLIEEGDGTWPRCRPEDDRSDSATRPIREIPDRPGGDRLRSGGAPWGRPPVRWCSDSGGVHPSTGLTALQCASLVLGESTPDAGVLAGAQGPVQARLHHRAAAAHGLGLLDLHDCRAGRPDREEQLRILVPAERAVAPVHGGVLLGVVYVWSISRRLRTAVKGRHRFPSALAQRLLALLPARCVLL